MKTVLASPLNQPKGAAMAKGQKKSNKEVRKPKADKVKAAPATAGFANASKSPVK